MARYVRSIRDKLNRLVSRDAGPELQETLHALLKTDDMLDRDEMISLVGEALRTAVTRGSGKAVIVILNMEMLQQGEGSDRGKEGCNYHPQHRDAATR